MCQEGTVNLAQTARLSPLEVERPRSFSRRRSPHSIRRTIAFGEGGGEPTAAGLGRPGRGSGPRRERTRSAQMGRRLEAAHLALALSGRLMRDLGAVVRVPIGAVDHGRHHRTACGRVAAELVRNQPSWDTALTFQEFPKESHGGVPIPSRLHEDVDGVDVLVYGAPQRLLATLNRDEQLVQMPGVTHPTAAAPKTSSVHRAEPLTPLPDGFIGDRDATLD